ncbi:MAG: B12-binding domain-containing radical SAM protein [Planctomycetes bacterium]|nr:B12-binding domain-containing radical SAM protein [Planctomycetota bacterium]
MPMKLLLINPRLPESFWSFSWAFQKVARDKRAAISPLGLATLAALTPGNWDITIVDENVEPIDWEADADIVGVCGMAVQFPRQKEIVSHFRNKGAYAVVGGSYASLCPEEYRDVADTVVAGEAEYIWPQFCADFARGKPLARYQETGSVDLEDSPTPRHDLLKLERYQSVAVQFSRGCPFRCEFCDIIITFGRKPRAKSLPQIERELNLLRERGVRNVFFVDDNLIGHLPRCRELLRMLAEYQRRHSYRFAFGAETSANVATQSDLLGLLRAASFEWVFIGIETPSREALLETLKTQNTRADLLSSLRTVYAHGIDVYGSFVVGFDADDPSVFERQYQFIIESGIVVASVAMLLALPRTPLFERLQRDGRLQSPGEGHHLWNNLIGTNIIPQNMTYSELVLGFRELIRRITDDAAIGQRIRNKLPHLGSAPVPFQLDFRSTLAYLGRFLVQGVLRGGVRRWYHVARSLVPVLFRPRLVPFVILNWVYGIAIQEFVREHLRQYGALPIREEMPVPVPKKTNQLAVIVR